MEIYTVANDIRTEFTEKKSVFISDIFFVSTEEEASERLEAIKKIYPDATHHCWAYRLRDNGREKCSDDGEPAGTAGRPMLEVLLSEEITNVCVVVTRYFGGTLLGTGGLLRAYMKSAKDALDAAGVAVVRRWVKMDIPCTYSLAEKLKLECASFDGVLQDTQYGAEVTLKVLIPEERAEEFSLRITDVTAGACKAITCGEEFMPVRIK